MTELKIKEIISRQLGMENEKISAESQIVHDLGADSLDLIQIVIAIEEEFGITVEEDEYADADTIEKITQLVDSKIAG